MIGAFVDGLAQGSITLRRRTLTAAITSHIVINLFGCLVVIYYCASLSLIPVVREWSAAVKIIIAAR